MDRPNKITNRNTGTTLAFPSRARARASPRRHRASTRTRRTPTAGSSRRLDRDDHRPEHRQQRRGQRDHPPMGHGSPGQGSRTDVARVRPRSRVTRSFGWTSCRSLQRWWRRPARAGRVGDHHRRLAVPATTGGVTAAIAGGARPRRAAPRPRLAPSLRPDQPSASSPARTLAPRGVAREPESCPAPGHSSGMDSSWPARALPSDDGDSRRQHRGRWTTPASARRRLFTDGR